VGGLELSPLARYQHIYLTAAAVRANQSIAPIKHNHLGAVSPGLLSRIRLDLMLA
jgi:hypothetical protein